MLDEEVVRMEHTMHEVVRASGVTSRTLRHYADVGVLTPVRTGPGGIRIYDDAALVRLQRILVLRSLGLGLPAIRDVLDGHRDDAAALAAHLDDLRGERERLDRRIASVATTLERLEGGENPMADEMFDGFDHTQHRDEVEQRWGRAVYAEGDRWWRGLSDAERGDWRAASDALIADWRAAAERGIDPTGDEAQRLAARQVAWLGDVPGTPRAADGTASLDYAAGLGETYVADQRFAANYGGASGAAFVRDALAAFVARASH